MLAEEEPHPPLRMQQVPVCKYFTSPTNKQIRITLLIFFGVIFLFCIVVFVFGFKWIGFKNYVTMVFCRLILSAIGAVLLIACIVVLLMEIFAMKKHDERPHHVATSLKLFLFVMTFISSIGYIFKIPFIVVLWNYDFALKWHFKVPENVCDIIYSVVIVVYMWIQLPYICFRFPLRGFPNHYKIWFGLVLIINFSQKWLYESLEGKEEVCERMNKTCHHFETNLTDLSKNEQKAYFKMEMIDPATYSATMELLVASVVVLCLTQPDDNHGNDAEGHSVPDNGAGLSSGTVQNTGGRANASADASENISQNIPATYLDTTRIQKICIFCFYVIIGLSVFCIGTKLWTTFQSDDHSRNLGFLYYNILRAVSTLVSFLCNSLLLTYYRNKSLSIRNTFAALCHFWQHREPDLIILTLAYVLYVLHAIPALALRSLVFKNVVEYSLINFCLWFAAILLSIFAFLIDLFFLDHLSKTDEKDIKRLSKNKFFCYMVLYQMIKNFIRATMYWIILLDPEVPDKGHEESHNYMHELVAVTNTFYPFTPLMNITSGLCWGHVLERLWSNGMNKWFTTCGSADIDLPAQQPPVTQQPLIGIPSHLENSEVAQNQYEGNYIDSQPLIFSS